MSRFRCGLAALVIAMITGPVAVSAEPACLGEPVIEIDQAADAVDPFDLAGSPRSPGGLDIRAWRAEWTGAGLAVEWTTAAPFTAPPRGGASRLLLLGHVGPFDGSVPYVYVQAARAHDGRTRWAYGLGTHTPADTGMRRHRRWTDHWTVEARPDAHGSTMRVLVPANRMYAAGTWNSTHWAGIGAVQSTLTDDTIVAQSFHGQATRPVAATALLGAAPGLWGLADAAPGESAAGSPVTGYEIAYSRGSPGYRPLLCRPDAPLATGPARSCGWTWDTTEPGWFAAPIDVAGHAPDTTIDVRVASGGPAGGTVTIGLLSPAGETEIFYNSLLNDDAATVAVGPAGHVRAPLVLGSSVGAGISFSRSRPFIRTGRWWVVVLATGSQTLRAEIAVEAAGIACAGARTGTRVAYVPGIAFAGGVGASASPTSLPVAEAHSGGSRTVVARGTLLAFFAGSGGSLGGAATLWERAPAGDVQSAESLVPPLCSCSEVARSAIVEAGGPGVYEFGVTAAATSGAFNWNRVGLLVADMDLE